MLASLAVFVSDDVGRFIGDRYQIVRELGRGGMGVVYLGRDLRREMDVAIKFRGITHQDATLWLKREFRSAALLRHPNLVELYELVAHDQSCYFTMEYLPGVDPRHWVMKARRRDAEASMVTDQTTHHAVPLQEARTERTLTQPPVEPAPVAVPEVDFSRVRAVLAQLAEALAFLHARGVIHRDVKPSNVIVADGKAKLLDFGLALERRRAEEEVLRETRIVGTAAYLAPEYIERLDVSPAMDVYSLGVLGFELVTGAPPFGGTLHVLSRLKRKLSLPRASDLNPDVPRDLDELIDQMLAADPQRRPTALQAAVQLDGALSSPRTVRRPTQFVGRQRELAVLEARIADIRPISRLVLVTGPSGVGKSALVEQALSRARIATDDSSGGLVWRGRCHERERVPYRAFDFIIDDLASELAALPSLAATIEHLGAMCRVFPTLGSAIEAGRAPAAEDLRVERERAQIAMTQLFQRVIGTRGMIVIDDLQWADEDSLELMALVVERVARPLTIIATWTTDGELPEHARALLERLGPAAEQLAIAEMTSAELVELMETLAPDAPTDRLQAAARQAAGNPYLAELIGRELAEADGHADPHHAERRRLQRLTPAERTVAEIVSLALGVATFEQLRGLAALPSAQLSSVLRGLEDGRVLKVAPSASGEPVYTFYHQRLRAAARDGMAPEARSSLHGRFAEWLEHDGAPADQLAFHHEHAGQRDRAAQCAIAAADAARAQLAWLVAADWYGRAIALGAPDVDRGADKAECLFLGGKLAAAATEFEALADAVPTMEPDGLGPARGNDGDRWRVRAAESYIKLGELERGLAILDNVLASRGEPRARGRVASAARAIGVAARFLLPGGPREPVDAVLVAAYRVIASFLSTPYPIESFEYVLRGIHIADRAGDHDAHGLGMAMLAGYLAAGSLGRFGDRALAAAHRVSAQSSSPYPRMVAAGTAGMMATVRGDWAGMRAAHEEAQRICTKLGLERSWEASFLRTYQGLGELYAGEPTRALAILGELAETSDDMISRAMLGSYRGRALVTSGDLPAARALERELDRQPAARRGMASIYRQVFAGELALAERDWQRAEAIGHELARATRAQWLSTMPAVSALVDTLLATAELGKGDRASARRARARARSLYRLARPSFYAATALRLWGQAERALGNHAEARRVLARATAVAAERGGKVDRLALARLTGATVDCASLAFAVGWNTAGAVE